MGEATQIQRSWEIKEGALSPSGDICVFRLARVDLTDPLEKMGVQMSPSQ